MLEPSPRPAGDSPEIPFASVSARLAAMAAALPDAVAVAEPLGGGRYRQLTFRELADDSDRLARGLLALGLPPGARAVLLVRPGVDFVSLVFGMLRAGLVMILIDPGMGRRNLIRCLSTAEPAGFIAVPLAQAIRALRPGRFPHVRWPVTVGRRWFWGGPTLADVRRLAPADARLPPLAADDPAAIIFTTGSTGPPKGVLYHQGQFARQVAELQAFYGIEPGEIDLPGFPLFALFNAALGVTTVFPEMDFTRPARVDPRKIVAAARRWQATQAFGSPALWNVVGRYCEREQATLPSIRRVLSAGAPVPPHVLARMKQAIAPEGDVHTPYGATEALPVASIAASELLAETAALTGQGRGVCVGRRFPGIAWRVIAIDDGPLPTLADTRELPRGEIGELLVSGPVVTRSYVTDGAANALHKVADGERVWHRLGDVGYLDEHDRFWFCGRKAHRVQTPAGVLFTIPCEGIINTHADVYRSALVGVGPVGRQRPVIIVEPWPERRPRTARDRQRLRAELLALAAGHETTAAIRDALLHRSLPVDIRHNAKIFREQLAPWAARYVRPG